MASQTATAPLGDPTYQPKHPPVGGQIPDVVAKWGPRSQLRWFRRFGAELGRRKDWDQYFCQSEHHRDLCCYSCGDEGDQGVQGWGLHCCCRDDRIRR